MIENCQLVNMNHFSQIESYGVNVIFVVSTGGEGSTSFSISLPYVEIKDCLEELYKILSNEFNKDEFYFRF